MEMHSKLKYGTGDGKWRCDEDPGPLIMSRLDPGPPVPDITWGVMVGLVKRIRPVDLAQLLQKRARRQ